MNTKPNIHVPSGSGKSFWGPGGDRYRFLITGETSGGSCFTVECLVPPGGGPPMHTHLREDECFYLLEGELEIEVGGQESRCPGRRFRPCTAWGSPHLSQHGIRPRQDDRYLHPCRDGRLV